MKILYDQGCVWEKDFILKELLDNSLQNIEYYSSFPFDIDKNYILIFSSNKHTFQDVYNFTQANPPIIIFHCSDEWGNKPEYDLLNKNCKLYLRQYRNYPQKENIKVCSLGYTSGLFENTCLTHKQIEPKNRLHEWVFTGMIKQDRLEMLHHFSHTLRGYNPTKAYAQDLINLYSNGIFAPIGRGNKSLNCFRIYEAMSCGSIPVIVGNKQETEFTFLDEYASSWLFFDSWKEAAYSCKEMLSDLNFVTQKHFQVVNSWHQRIFQIKSWIKTCLTDFLY